MTLTTILEEMEAGLVSDTNIAEYRNFCAVWLFRYNEEYGRLASESAVWQTEHSEEYKSQAACERAWEATEKGQRTKQPATLLLQDMKQN